MYKNLRREMRRKAIYQKDLARILGISEVAVNYKMNGKTNFSMKDAEIIRDTLFPHCSIDYLFFDK